MVTAHAVCAVPHQSKKSFSRIIATITNLTVPIAFGDVFFTKINFSTEKRVKILDNVF